MNQKTVITIGVVGVALYFIAKREAATAAKDIGAAVNPTSDENIVYKGVNAVGAIVADDSDFNLGHWIYDKIHGGD